MKIWKAILIIVGITVMTAYLIFALFFVIPTKDESLCNGLKVEILDSRSKQFVSAPSIVQTITKKYPNIVGKKFCDIDLDNIETTILENPMVKNVACYKIQNGNLKIDITQREPVFRVVANLKSYYIDIEGKEMPTSVYYSVYVPVVTGYVNRQFIEDKLFNFIVFLQNDKFLRSQIEQIHVCPNLEIELVPRVGDQIIYLGKLDNYEEKLERLQTFYEKGLNQTGWNQYSGISLKYKDQVVCTKKTK